MDSSSQREPLKEKSMTIKTATDIIKIDFDYHSQQPVRWYKVSEKGFTLQPIEHSEKEDHTIEDQFINFLAAIRNPGTQVIASAARAVHVVRILAEIDKMFLN